MTNKEKYSNAKIKGGEKPFVLLDKNDIYLTTDGKVSSWYNLTLPYEEKEKLFYFKSFKQAETALNNFMNETSEITLKEIKLQLEEAKKLVGKKIKNSYSNKVQTCERVFFAVERGADTSVLMNEEINKNGYCIGVRTVERDTFPLFMCEEIKTISVVAHDGQTYTAESDGDCWKFGCARISKTLIKQSLNLMNDKTHGGNRQIEKITIGKCDFTRETLKALVELGE